MRWMTLPLMILAACSSPSRESEPEPGAVSFGDRIGFAPLEEARRESLITLPAEVVTAPRASLSLSPPVAGRLTAVLVKPGQTIEPGDVLAELEVPELDGDRAMKAMLEKRRNQQRTALTTAKRRLELGLGSTVEVQDAERALTEAEAALTDLETRLDRAERTGLVPAKTGRAWSWRALQAGTVSESALRVGMGVSPEEHLVDLVDAAVMEVRVALPERYLSRSRDAVTATFLPRGGREPVLLALGRRAAAVEPTTRTLDLYFTVPDEADLLAGQTGRAELTVPAADDLFTVPARAVARIDGRDVVFRANGTESRDAEQVPVRIEGRTESGLLIRAEGLRPGDQIAVRGVFLLKSVALLGSES